MKKSLLFLGLHILALATFASDVAAQANPPAANQLERMLCRAGMVIGNSATVIVVIAWILVGIFFLASVGSTERFSAAKRALFWVIIGTIVCLLAWSAIVIINKALGTSGGLINCYPSYYR